MIEFSKKDGSRMILAEDNLAGALKSVYDPSIRIFMVGDRTGIVLTENEVDIAGLWRVLEIALSRGKNVYRVSTPEKGTS